jgi:predicted glutamine amidotransferase
MGNRMCELLGLSSRLPTTVNLSMHVLARHGNLASGLDDGWGVAFHMGDDALLVKQPGPADESPWIDFLASHPIRGGTVVSHIRRATQGEVSLRNTQPFMRELGGRMHVFAHNGRLLEIERRFAGALCRFRPVGSTDSEVAFCVLLDRLAPLWDGGTPSPSQRLREIGDVAEMLRARGPANFLYTDGELLVAHAHRRTQQDGSIAPPGLWMLHRSCAVDPGVLASAGVTMDGDQLVTLFASVPLTNEAWQPLQEGEIAAAHHGVLVRHGT